jgi:hypothetical protein
MFAVCFMAGHVKYVLDDVGFSHFTYGFLASNFVLVGKMPTTTPPFYQ